MAYVTASCLDILRGVSRLLYSGHVVSPTSCPTELICRQAAFSSAYRIQAYNKLPLVSEKYLSTSDYFLTHIQTRNTLSVVYYA
jgi:hypothetical protein